MDLAIKIIFLVVFFAVMIAIGIMTRKKANSVEGFVLGGRNAGPWLTAFGYGTSYSSDTQDSSAGNTVSHPPGSVSATQSSVHFSHGSFSEEEQES